MWLIGHRFDKGLKGSNSLCFVHSVFLEMCYLDHTMYEAT